MQPHACQVSSPGRLLGGQQGSTSPAIGIIGVPARGIMVGCSGHWAVRNEGPRHSESVPPHLARQWRPYFVLQWCRPADRPPPSLTHRDGKDMRGAVDVHFCAVMSNTLNHFRIAVGKHAPREHWREWLSITSHRDTRADKMRFNGTSVCSSLAERERRVAHLHGQPGNC
jgi:hypothetical protein